MRVGIAFLEACSDATDASNAAHMARHAAVGEVADAETEFMQKMSDIHMMSFALSTPLPACDHPHHTGDGHCCQAAGSRPCFHRLFGIEMADFRAEVDAPSKPVLHHLARLHSRVRMRSTVRTVVGIVTPADSFARPMAAWLPLWLQSWWNLTPSWPFEASPRRGHHGPGRWRHRQLGKPP